MNCKDMEQYWGNWLREAEDSPSLPVLSPDQTGHIASCLQCRTKYLALKRLFDLDQPMWTVPSTLAQSILQRIQTSQPEKVKAPIWNTAQIRLVWAMAAGLIILLSGIWIGGRWENSNGMVSVRLHFQGAGVQSVSVAGDWNDWNPEAQPMRQIDHSGTWEITIQVKKGVDLRYQFIVNKTNWLPDPLAPIKVQDQYGGTNSILHI